MEEPYAEDTVGSTVGQMVREKENSTPEKGEEKSVQDIARQKRQYVVTYGFDVSCQLCRL